MGDRMFASEGDSVHVGRPLASWEDRWHNSPPRGIETGRVTGPRDAPAGDEVAAGVVRRLQSRVDRHRWLLERMQSDPLQPEPAGLPELLDTVRRMRRDTESLLILHGQNPGVPPGARRLSDVLAAAAAAAEEPRRVDVRPALQATVSPAGATELLHVLAELVDHVTAVYPGSRVEVTCRTETPGGVAVEVRADGATRHDPEGLGGRRALAAAQRLAQRSLSGIVLRTPAPGISASGPVASIHCPGSVVGVDPVGVDPVGVDRPGVDRPGVDPAGVDPLGADPLGVDPFGVDPFSAGPRTPGSRTADLFGADPFSADPFSADPFSADPFSADRAVGEPVAAEPVAAEPARPEPVRADGAGADPEPERALSVWATRRRAPVDPATPDPLALDPLFSGPLPLERLLAEPTRLEPTHLGPGLSSPRANGNGPGRNGTGNGGNGHGGNGHAGAARPSAPAYVPSAGSGVDELFGPMLDLAHDPADDHGATPIFEAIASAWFREDEAAAGGPRTGDGAPRAGVPDGRGRHGGGAPRNWETPSDSEWRAAAERAARPEPEAQTPTGLPRRRPGNQLVPPPRGGRGVPEPEQPERVPDRVRERLSTYQRGLRQGRHRAEPAADPGDPAAW